MNVNTSAPTVSERDQALARLSTFIKTRIAVAHSDEAHAIYRDLEAILGVKPVLELLHERIAEHHPLWLTSRQGNRALDSVADQRFARQLHRR